VEIFHRALADGRYECYLGPETYLDMMYMPDAVRAAIQLMEAEASRLKHRNGFNVTAMSVSPAMFERAIRKHIPGFSVIYRIDPLRQRIADSWPDSMDDRAAREEWGWKPAYDLAAMTREMLRRAGWASAWRRQGRLVPPELADQHRPGNTISEVFENLKRPARAVKSRPFSNRAPRRASGLRSYFRFPDAQVCRAQPGQATINSTFFQAHSTLVLPVLDRQPNGPLHGPRLVRRS
jgi:hypothetical protein